jgi:NADH-ubiquinone oxidoreductase chain 1
MTEHSAVIFVFFFLAEYASIILMCILISTVFLGGYNYNSIFINIYYILSYISDDSNSVSFINNMETYSILEGVISGLVLAVKSMLLVFAFI